MNRVLNSLSYFCGTEIIRMIIVDTRGMTCPAPLIETRKALKESGRDEGFHIIIDRPGAFNNISSYLHDNGIEFTSEEADGTWSLFITGIHER
jgi:tRNA 2-thiouridine synthesizing protein A